MAVQAQVTLHTCYFGWEAELQVGTDRSVRTGVCVWLFYNNLLSVCNLIKVNTVDCCV